MTTDCREINQDELDSLFARIKTLEDELARIRKNRAAWLTIEEMAEVIYCNVGPCSKSDARFVAEMIAAESKAKGLRASP